MARAETQRKSRQTKYTPFCEWDLPSIQRYGGVETLRRTASRLQWCSAVEANTVLTTTSRERNSYPCKHCRATTLCRAPVPAQGGRAVDFPLVGGLSLESACLSLIHYTALGGLAVRDSGEEMASTSVVSRTIAALRNGRRRGHASRCSPRYAAVLPRGMS